MGLDFEDFSFLEGVHDDLDRAWLVLLVDAREEGPAVVHHFDLIKVDVLLKSLHLFSIFEFSDRLVHASGEDQGRGLLTVGFVRFYAGELDILELFAPNWVLLTFLGVECPHVDGGVPGRGDEASVVVEPSN